MKKTKVFFMKLLIGIVLLGFSGTSSAYDLSKWTSKPVEWAKQVAQWLGYEDKDDKRPVTVSAVVAAKEPDTRKIQEYTVTASSTRDRYNQTDSAIFKITSTLNFNPETADYGIRVSSPYNNVSLDLYRWHEERINPLAFTDINFNTPTPSVFEQNLKSNSIRNSSVAARLSYSLPFLRHLHQGISPAVSLESSYRFEGSISSYTGSGLPETDYRWRTGLSYRGSNLINSPLSPVGINWGAGYDYNVSADNFGRHENNYESYSYHSGNIFAGSYWHNLKLYTMFMYRYDIESRGSMTTFKATYSPSLRWTYGVRANFYNSSKENSEKNINSNPELVSFTATYRWD